jgi:3-oxoadipate enol-lactonase
MPEVDAGGPRLSYELEGPPQAPVLLLSNSLGTSLDLWQPQRAAFARSFRLVRYDTRGHGRSQAPPGPYTLDRLGRDALAVLDAAGASRAHVCGISLGGLPAMWLGIHAPRRVERLVLANTAARIGTPELWEERMASVRAQGMAALADAAMPRWFTPAFRERDPARVEALRSAVAACPVEGYAGCCAALRDADLTAAIGGIAAATLVVAGAHDPATPPSAAEGLRDRIPGARLVTLDAAHLSNVEAAGAFTSAVMAFLLAEESVHE